MTLEKLEAGLLAVQMLANQEIYKLEQAIKELKQQPQQPKLERWKPEGEKPYFYATDLYPSHSLWWKSLPDEIRYENFNCFQTQEEVDKEFKRTRARRKLEWLARELNGKREKPELGQYVIVANYIVQQLHVQTGAIAFYNAIDAQYALSQMTSEELEALR